jgi:protein TonB
MASVSPNGVGHVQLAQPLRGGAYGAEGSRGRDPLDGVLDLGRNASRIVLITLLGATILHGAAVARAEVIPLEMMAWTKNIGRQVHYRLVETYEIDIVKPPEAPPPPPEPEPVKEIPKEVAPPPLAVKDTTPPPAAPAAARASAVLTAPADPDAPANFDGIITGTGETFAGGNTAAAGTSDTAVRAKPVAVGGVANGTGTAAKGPAVGVDHTRLAGVSGSTDWNCPFPAEADSDQIDQAFPTIQVSVRADGSPEHVTILSDPGHGFGRAALRCAMQQHYQTALDHDGTPIPGVTQSLRVRFER